MVLVMAIASADVEEAGETEEMVVGRRDLEVVRRTFPSS